jgi:hypothetical protein
MLIMLANENATSDGATDGEQIDTVALAHQQLKKHPAWCKIHPPHDGADKKLARPTMGQANSQRERQAVTQAEQNHIHGSVRCITAFFGDKNWSESKVGRLFRLGGLHDDVKAITVFGERRVNHQGTQKGTVSYQGAIPRWDKAPQSKFAPQG